MTEEPIDIYRRAICRVRLDTQALRSADDKVEELLGKHGLATAIHLATKRYQAHRADTESGIFWQRVLNGLHAKPKGAPLTRSKRRKLKAAKKARRAAP